jgi:hypothetical protein
MENSELLAGHVLARARPKFDHCQGNGHVRKMASITEGELAKPICPFCRAPMNPAEEHDPAEDPASGSLVSHEEDVAQAALLVAKKVSDNAVRAQYNMLLVQKIKSDMQVEQSKLELAKVTMQLQALKMRTAQISAPESAASHAVEQLVSLDAIDFDDADVDGEFDRFFE